MLDELLSEDGRWRLRMNGDGNMVLYQVSKIVVLVRP